MTDDERTTLKIETLEDELLELKNRAQGLESRLTHLETWVHGWTADDD